MIINVIEELKVQKITALSEAIMTAPAAWPKGLGRGTGVVKTDSCPKCGWSLVMLGSVGGQCSLCTLPSSGGMNPALSTQQEAQSCGLHLGWLFWKDTGRRSFCFCPPNVGEEDSPLGIWDVRTFGSKPDCRIWHPCSNRSLLSICKAG